MARHSQMTFEPREVWRKGVEPNLVFICDVIGLQAIVKKKQHTEHEYIERTVFLDVFVPKDTMSGEAVKVIVRCRPMNEREKKLECKVGHTSLCSAAQFDGTCLEQALSSNP